MSDFATAPIHVFQRVRDMSGGGVEFIARFYPYDDFPILFSGNTKDDVAQKARDWREEQLEKYAKVREVKLENARKAREAKQRKAKV